MDEKTHVLLQSKGIDSFYWRGYSAQSVTEGSTTFRSKNFNLIVVRKKEASLAVLKLGYDIIFADVDLAIVRDPVPYLLIPGVDYQHSINEWCPMNTSFNLTVHEGNTGFYYARSNHRNLKVSFGIRLH